MFLRPARLHNRQNMFRNISRIFVWFAVAGFALLCATRALVPQASASAASAGDVNQPVIRFVKNPELAPPLQALDLAGRQVNKDNWGGKF